MKKTFATLALATLALQAAPAAHAATIRFEYNTEADLSRTQANNGWWQNETGTYSGVITTITGLNAAIVGHLDIERLPGQVDRVIGYAFNVVTPHGVSPGFNNPDWQIQYSSTVDMSPEGPQASHVISELVLNIYQTAQFDPFHGPKAFGSQSPVPYYNPDLRQTYPFRQRILFTSVAGAGPDGGAAWAVSRVEFNCHQYPNGGGGASGCNGYYSGNLGVWDRGSGLPASFGAIPVPTVPLAPSLPLLMAGVAAFGFLRRRRT